MGHSAGAAAPGAPERGEKALTGGRGPRRLAGLPQMVGTQFDESGGLSWGNAGRAGAGRVTTEPGGRVVGMLRVS